MRKKTVYQVTGVGDSKPKDLPEGFKVEQLEVPDIETLEIRAFHFADSCMHENGVYIREDQTSLRGRHLTKEETRQVRDFFNKILGEEPKMRVLLDSSGDWWFELVPGLFTFGSQYARGKTALQDAQQSREGDDSRYVDWDEAKLRSYYGFVEDVTDTWEG